MMSGMGDVLWVPAQTAICDPHAHSLSGSEGRAGTGKNRSFVYSPWPGPPIRAKRGRRVNFATRPSIF